MSPIKSKTYNQIRPDTNIYTRQAHMEYIYNKVTDGLIPMLWWL